MRLVLIVLIILLPSFSFAQSGFKIKIGQAEYSCDKIPDKVVLPQRFNKFMIKKETSNAVPTAYIVQIGEEEHKFTTDGAYHEVVFNHDVKGLMISILNDKRIRQGKAFVLRRGVN